MLSKSFCLLLYASAALGGPVLGQITKGLVADIRASRFFQILSEHTPYRIKAWHMTAFIRGCSLIPGLASSSPRYVLAGPTVLSAFGLSPPHHGAW